MEYAIETLHIELFKCKQSLRTEEHYSAFPEYHGAPVDYKERITELETGIQKLKSDHCTECKIAKENLDLIAENQKLRDEK